MTTQESLLKQKFIRVLVHCFRAFFCQTSALKPIRRPNSRFIRYSDYFWQLPGNFLLNYQLLLVIALNFFGIDFGRFVGQFLNFFTDFGEFWTCLVLSKFGFIPSRLGQELNKIDKFEVILSQQWNSAGTILLDFSPFNKGYLVGVPIKQFKEEPKNSACRLFSTVNFITLDINLILILCIIGINEVPIQCYIANVGKLVSNKFSFYWKRLTIWTMKFSCQSCRNKWR